MRKAINYIIFAMLLITSMPILSQDFPEIITPNGSETLYVGANYEIEWTGISPADTVTIEYSLDRCSNWIMITEKATGLKYTWKNIPNTISNNCLLRIRKYKKFTAGVDNGFVQMTGHNSRVFAAKYSPNGLFAATGSGDTKMIIWDVVNNSIYKSVTINSGDIYGISYSKDGYEIATSHSSGKSMVWNAINGKKISELSGVFSGWCNFSVFNPNDCNIIASCDGGGNLIVWNKITKTVKYKVKAHNALLHQVDYSPDGKYIATAGYDFLVKIWDAETGQLVKTLTDHNAAVYSAMWSPNGQYLSACGGVGDLKVNIWETKNWTLINSMSGHSNKINSCPWNKDNNKVLSSSDDGSAIEWDVFNGSILRVINNQVSGIYFADYSPKNSRIITAGLDATVNIYGKDTLDYTEDISENVWSIVPSNCTPIEVLSITRPNGKERFKVGTNELIEWTGISANDTVTLEYSLDKCRTWIPITNKATGLKYLWQNIPNTISDYCLLRARRYKNFETNSLDTVTIIQAHNSNVYRIAWSKDGTKSVSCSKDGTIIVWDAICKKKIISVNAHQNGVYAIAISSDNKYIATGSNDNRIKIWNINDLSLKIEFPSHLNLIHGLSFNNNCNLLASASADNTIVVWDIETGQKIRTFLGHTSEVISVNWRNDDKQLVSTSWDKTVKIWDYVSGNNLLTYNGHKSYTYYAYWSPNNKYISSSSGVGELEIHIWDSQTGNLDRVFSGHTNKINTVPWSPDGKRVLSSSDDGKIIEWEVSTGKKLKLLNDLSSGVYFADYSPTGGRIFAGALDGKIAFYGKDTIPYIEDISDLEWAIETKLCISNDIIKIIIPNGKENFNVGSSQFIEWTGVSVNDTVALEYSIDKCNTWFPITQKATGLKFLWQNIPKTISNNCLLRIRRYKNYETDKLDTNLIVNAHKSNVYRIEWSKDGSKVISASKDGEIIIWNSNCKTIISKIYTNSIVYALSINYDGTLLAVGNEEGKIDIYNLIDGNIKFRILNNQSNTHFKLIAGLTWANECNKLASCSEDGTMKTYEIDSYKDSLVFNIKTFIGHLGMVHSVQWSPDNTKLLTTSWDKTVKIWDYSTTSNLSTYNGHKSYTYYAYWSPDGKKIASSSGVGELEIHIWDAQTGTKEKSLIGHTNKINTVPWSPDGKKILSSSDDGTIIEWDEATGNKIRTFNDLSSGVYFADYSPFGGRIFAGAVDGKVAFYGKDIIPYIEDMSDLAWAIVPMPNQPCGFSAFDYKSFKTNTNVVLKEDTKLKDSSVSLLKLQPFSLGALLNKSKVFFKNGFTTSFSFSSANGNNNQNYDASLPGADGVTLVLQNNPSVLLGGRGGEIGFNGIPNAIALEIDTYRNGLDYNDVNGNHIAIQATKDGKVSSHHDNSLAINNDIFILKDNIRYYVKMDYDALKKHIDVYLDTNNNLLNKVLSVDNVNLDQIFGSNNGNCWIGITSASGVAYADYYIHNWSYCEKDGSFISNVETEQSTTMPNQHEIYSEIFVYNQIGQFIQSSENVSINQLKASLRRNEPLFFYCKNTNGSKNYKLIIE